MATPEIHVDVADIERLLIAGEWTRIRDVVVSFAEFTVTDAAGTRTTHARGPHLAATIVGGPRNGDRVIVAVAAIEAITVAP